RRGQGKLLVTPAAPLTSDRHSRLSAGHDRARPGNWIVRNGDLASDRGENPCDLARFAFDECRQQQCREAIPARLFDRREHGLLVACHDDILSASKEEVTALWSFGDLALETVM